MDYISIRGLGAYSPEDAVSNAYIERFVDTEDQWIVERTGIRSRRMTREEDTSKLAAKAAQRALEDAGIDASQVGLLIVGTATPDCFTPSTACLVQKEVAASNAICFDISAACSGFVYGLDIAQKYMQASSIDYALVIGAETLSKVMDWEDRNTCVLFGDGAGAVVLGKGEKRGIHASYLGSKGDDKESLFIPAVSVKNLLGQVEPRPQFLNMNGREVFKFAVGTMPKCIRKVMEEAKLSADDIDYIVPHQANYRIIQSVAEKMGIAPEKFFMNVETMGNTSSASIPLALNEMKEKNLLRKGMKIVLVGFGGGLTWGSLLIEW